MHRHSFSYINKGFRRTNNKLYSNDLLGRTPDYLAYECSCIRELHVGKPQRDVPIFQLIHEEVCPEVEGRVLLRKGLTALPVHEGDLLIRTSVEPLHCWEVTIIDIDVAGQDDRLASKGQDLHWCTHLLDVS